MWSWRCLNVNRIYGSWMRRCISMTVMAKFSTIIRTHCHLVSIRHYAYWMTLHTDTRLYSFLICEGWRVEDYLCVFKLELYHPPGSDPLSVPAIGTPRIVNAKPLAGSLMRAITSVKWSSTSRYILTGFGVRSDGRVQDHSHPYVTRPPPSIWFYLWQVMFHLVIFCECRSIELLRAKFCRSNTLRCLPWKWSKMSKTKSILLSFTPCRGTVWCTEQSAARQERSYYQNKLLSPLWYFASSSFCCGPNRNKSLSLSIVVQPIEHECWCDSDLIYSWLRNEYSRASSVEAS